MTLRTPDTTLLLSREFAHHPANRCPRRPATHSWSPGSFGTGSFAIYAQNIEDLTVGIF
jgi:hypothetical protein